MSISTTGFIVTELKNPFPLLGLIEQVIRKLLYPHWNARLEREARRDGVFPNAEFSSPVFKLNTPSSGSVQTSFTYKGEQRTLWVHFLCDSDYGEVSEGSKVILSLGDYGMSRPLLRALLQPLSVFGAAYLDESDCDDRGPERLFSERKVNLMDLFAAKLITANCVNVAAWYEMWKNYPQLQSMPLSDFIGLSEDEVSYLKNAGLNYEERMLVLGNLLEQYIESTAEPLDLGLQAIDDCFKDWPIPF